MRKSTLFIRYLALRPAGCAPGPLKDNCPSRTIVLVSLSKVTTTCHHALSRDKGPLLKTMPIAAHIGHWACTASPLQAFEDPSWSM
eukprot:1180254-Prorocentrum_minimum.AAC.4